jgi:hypothetical protein
MNYHLNARKRGLSFWAVVRIAQRLAIRTGKARLAWINCKGRAHIIVEGPEGFQREPVPNPGPSDATYRLTGNVPRGPRSIDWANAGYVECRPC